MTTTEPETGLTWKAATVESVARMIERGARPEAFLRFGMDAQVVTWLTHAAAPDDTRILAVVALAVKSDPAWFRCGLCGHRGARGNGDLARAAVDEHFATNHAMVGRIRPEIADAVESGIRQSLNGG